MFTQRQKIVDDETKAKRKRIAKRKRLRALKQKKNEQKKMRDAQIETVPRSFVFVRGKVGTSVIHLTNSMKEVMMPYTAKNLKVQKSATMKDIIKFASDVYVTHFIIFSNRSFGTGMRIARLPRGPTLYFKVHSYCTSQDLWDFCRQEKLPFSKPPYTNPPLVVLNNFNQDKVHLKLAAATFQNMFPPVDVKNFKLERCKRVVLFNYNNDDDTIDMRCYVIKTQQIKTKEKITHKVDLVESGPRLKLSIIKITEGICSGDTIYHAHIKFTPEELAERQKRAEQIKAEKQRRKAIQQANIERKKKEKEEKLKQQQMKAEKARAEGLETLKKLAGENADQSDDDDAEWYRKEVGQEPPEELNLGKEEEKDKKKKKKVTFASKVEFAPDPPAIPEESKNKQTQKKPQQAQKKKGKKGKKRKIKEQPIFEKPNKKRKNK